MPFKADPKITMSFGGTQETRDKIEKLTEEWELNFSQTLNKIVEDFFDDLGDEDDN